jgi:hypothetical protein
MVVRKRNDAGRGFSTGNNAQNITRYDDTSGGDGNSLSGMSKKALLKVPLRENVDHLEQHRAYNNKKSCTGGSNRKQR